MQTVIATSPVDTIRQLMRKRRRAIAYGSQKRASYQLALRILNSSAYQLSCHIGVYWAVDGEIDLRYFIKKAWSQGKVCYLPVIEGEYLKFIRYMPGTVLTANRYGIPEPIAGKIMPPCNLDLVLTPLVAFDGYYHRIGMGGGYYDRTFSHNNHSYRRTFLMGVGHRCQRINKIVPKPWDVVLNQVIAV